MTIENDIDLLVSDVTTRKAAVVKAKGDLDAIVAEGASAAGQAEGAALAALSARDEASAMATASGALATASVGATAYADLAAVIAAKVENAVDVFIYDTSLDSDGGAWRYRTQGTSWYREALNTATRGSRREFPAVAVIVATATTVTIYDGDDLSLPMWMVFQAGTTRAMHPSYPQVAMLNARLVAGGNLYDANCIDFVGDRVGNSFSSPARAYLGNIAQRNASLNYGAAGTASWFALSAIISRTVNDVAMTVLPDAPIDPATGLPVPTIAVATDGGVSVIREDGNVWDIRNNDGANAARSVSFTPDQMIATQLFDDGRGLRLFEVPSADVVQPAHYTKGFASEWYEGVAAATGDQIGDLKLLSANASGYSFSLKRVFSDTLRIGAYGGLNTVLRNTMVPEQGMIAYTTKDYPSGWMPGAIKGAWLADTDEGDLAEATFADDFTFYADQAAAEAASWSFIGTEFDAGLDAIVFNGTGSANATLSGITLSNAGITNQFEVTVVVSGVTAGSISVQENFVTIGSFAASGTYAFRGVRAGSFRFVTANGFDGAIENVTFKALDADRSVNANGLIVHGRVRRAPVADGAELVAYSGFSAENYLEQPYNADLDFGTGDFAVMGWMRTNSSGWIFDTVDTGNAEGFAFFVSAGVGYFRTRENSNSQVIGSRRLDDGAWHFVVGVRSRGGVDHLLYVDGALDSSDTGASRSIGATQSPLVIGNRQIDFAAPFAGDLALLRITGTAPTADQIARIYNEERALFEPGAACTLYGDSDAVTALAHDKVTNLLHVGTSAGRSVFGGLRRVAHTTQPVGNAIAAHNGLIIED